MDFLKEEVFMHQPLGFEEKTMPHYICKLDKALYGLNLHLVLGTLSFSHRLQCLDFVPLKTDTSLFY